MSLAYVLSLLCGPLLTLCFQIELEMGTHTTARDIRRNAANTCTIVSGADRDILNTDTAPDIVHVIQNTYVTASKTHRNTLKPHEDTDNQSPVVSLYRLYSPCHRVTDYHRLDSR